MVKIVINNIFKSVFLFLSAIFILFFKRYEEIKIDTQSNDESSKIYPIATK